jgi:hypothetical protein
MPRTNQSLVLREGHQGLVQAKLDYIRLVVQVGGAKNYSVEETRHALRQTPGLKSTF